MEYLDKYIVRSEGMACRMIDGQAFLLNEEGTKMHLLNKVGSLILQYASGDVSIKDIVAKIVERFNVEEDVAQRDALEFIRKLVDMKILKIYETPV